MIKPIDQLKQELKFGARQFIPSDLLDKDSAVADLTSKVTEDIYETALRNQDSGIARALGIPIEDVDKYRHLVTFEYGEVRVEEMSEGELGYPASIVGYQEMTVRFKAPHELLGTFAKAYLDYWTTKSYETEEEQEVAEAEETVYLLFRLYEDREYHLGTYASEELAQAAGFESGYSDIEVRPEVIKH